MSRDLESLLARLRPWLCDARTRLVIAVVAGALLVPAFAPVGWFLLAPLMLLVLLALWHGRDPGQSFVVGYAFGVGYFGLGVYWVYISMHTFGQAPAPLAALMTVLLVAVLALFPALTGWLLARFWPRADLLRHALAFPLLWGALEWLRSWIFSGFPWLSLGYSQIDAPLGGFAPLLGVLFMGLLVALSAGLLWHALVARLRPAGITAGSLVVALWLGGVALDRVQWTLPAGEPLSVALVQGNVSQDQKWLPEMRRPTKARYRDLTLEHLGRDLIVWPEAALPRLFHQVADDFLPQLDDALAEAGSELLMGILVYDRGAGRYYNSVLAMGDPYQFYHKHHLVPFGEYFPVPDFVRRQLQLLNLPYQDFTRGDARQAPLRLAGLNIAASVCYEDLFGAWFAGTALNADLLVNVSNDAWFGDSLAPAQHLQIARMRARENGRMMLRTTNTGITAIIDARGRVVKALEQFQTGVLTGEAQAYEGTTPYTRWRDVPLLLTIFLGLVVTAGTRLMRGEK